MHEKLYKKYFSEEQLSKMKASTARQLQSQEDGMAVSVMLILISGILESITFIAMLFWTNKFTLFLTTIGSLFLIIFLLFHYAVIKKYKKLISETKEDIDKQ